MTSNILYYIYISTINFAKKVDYYLLRPVILVRGQVSYVIARDVALLIRPFNLFSFSSQYPFLHFFFIPRGKPHMSKHISMTSARAGKMGYSALNGPARPDQL